ncbi:MAG TPA: rhomboid family intramembrane serine protease [Steroidobacteraceae bacterium]|nr:rhomboid family intramembrane serine protease [Steroidobacteraceae bacterium]
MPSESVEVYRCRRRAPAEERAFVLTAVGIASELAREDDEYVLRVAAPEAHGARAHLERYEEEAQAVRTAAPLPPPRLHSGAWAGCALYGAVLFGVAYAVGSGIFRLDAFDRGDLDAGDVQRGEWWRAWTALTLHLDPAHLAANLAAGVWFGYLAGRLLGAGVAWVLIVNGAAAANLLEGLLAPPDHRSAGASTAVFTALGVLAAYSWRERRRLPQHWALRLSPLVAGVVLLGWLGTAGEHTDVFAHLAGFTVGVLLGALAAVPAVRAALERAPQSLAGALALAVLALAWGWALRD